MRDVGGKIAVFASEKSSHAASIVTASLIRSFSHAQICQLTSLENLSSQIKAIVIINPGEAEFKQVQDRLDSGLKLILLGALEDCWAALLGVQIVDFPLADAAGDTVVEDVTGHYSHSLWGIRYCQHELTNQVPYQIRYLSRYDFTDEWNNHGYGRVLLHEDDEYAISQCVQCAADGQELSWIENETGDRISAYCVQRDEEALSLLWCNRAVGLVDSLEWTILENYLGNYRSGELFCFPYLMEVPAGFTGVCTMRLDCDQAVASARSVFDLYCQAEIPFSLAILTGLSMNQADLDLIRDVVAHGGAIVAHSVTHQPNWGGSYEIALKEASESKKWLEANVPDADSPRYLVSPFHQNPRYAVQAMLDAGYAGFIGGIIHNDPDYLMARSGVVTYLTEANFFSLSQQCMLHGDCYHRYGNSMAPYLESLRYQLSCKGIFGYLDHPFSSEYQYGWLDEPERLAAHQELIQVMKSMGRIWFCNLNDCLDFCRARARTEVWVDTAGILRWNSPDTVVRGEVVATVQASWRGETYPLFLKKGNEE